MSFDCTPADAYVIRFSYLNNPIGRCRPLPLIQYDSSSGAYTFLDPVTKELTIANSVALLAAAYASSYVSIIGDVISIVGADGAAKIYKIDEVADSETSSKSKTAVPLGNEYAESLAASLSAKLSSSITSAEAKISDVSALALSSQLSVWEALQETASNSEKINGLGAAISKIDYSALNELSAKAVSGIADLSGKSSQLSSSVDDLKEANLAVISAQDSLSEKLSKLDGKTEGEVSALNLRFSNAYAKIDAEAESRKNADASLSSAAGSLSSFITSNFTDAAYLGGTDKGLVIRDDADPSVRYRIGISAGYLYAAKL